jgi:hypothetical protein
MAPNVIDLDSIPGLEVTTNEAGSPEAVASMFSWLVMAERRRSLNIAIRGGRIEVIDLVANEPFCPGEDDAFGLERPDRHADPGIFTDTNDVASCFDRIRRLNGPDRLTRRSVTPVRCCPPRTFAYVLRTDGGPDSMRLDFVYDVPRWKWRLRESFSRLTRFISRKA